MTFPFRCGEKLFNRYLYHILRHKSFRDRAKAEMTGAVGQQRVPKSFLQKYSLYLPSYDEQLEIVYLIMEGQEQENIKEILNLTQSEFNNRMNGIKAYENISILF